MECRGEKSDEGSKTKKKKAAQESGQSDCAGVSETETERREGWRGKGVRRGGVSGGGPQHNLVNGVLGRRASHTSCVTLAHRRSTTNLNLRTHFIQSRGPRPCARFFGHIRDQDVFPASTSSVSPSPRRPKQNRLRPS